MKQRVEQLVGEEASVIWMSTFHSMCVKIYVEMLIALASNEILL